MQKLLVPIVISLVGVFLLNPVFTDETFDPENEYANYSKEFTNLIKTEDLEEQKKLAGELYNQTKELEPKFDDKCQSNVAKCRDGLNQTKLEVDQSLKCFESTIVLCAQQLALLKIKTFLDYMSKNGVPERYPNSSEMLDEAKNFTKEKKVKKGLNSNGIIKLWQDYQNGSITMEDINNQTSLWSTALNFLCQEIIQLVNHHLDATNNSYIALDDFLQVYKVYENASLHSMVLDAIQRVTRDQLVDDTKGVIWIVVAVIIIVVIGIAFYIMCRDDSDQSTIEVDPKSKAKQGQTQPGASSSSNNAQKSSKSKKSSKSSKSQP